jgi:VIT1/CCC1 family predicted Fe2+/Mn2+ transporter
MIGQGPVNDDGAPDSPSLHSAEPHAAGVGQRLNWLRAGVLGANDGIVSTAGLVVGVAAVTPEPGPILTAGIAGLVAGAVSMALGEYVSVSSQRDTERALLAKEEAELRDFPEAELEELAAIYIAKGASVETATKLAEELTAHDAFAAHIDAELGIDPKELTNPWHAATSSAIAFTFGSILPIVAILLAPAGARIPITFARPGPDGRAQREAGRSALGPCRSPPGHRWGIGHGRHLRHRSARRSCRYLSCPHVEETRSLGTLAALCASIRPAKGGAIPWIGPMASHVKRRRFGCGPG